MWKQKLMVYQLNKVYLFNSQRRVSFNRWKHIFKNDYLQRNKDTWAVCLELGTQAQQLGLYVEGYFITHVLCII